MPVPLQQIRRVPFIALDLRSVEGLDQLRLYAFGTSPALLQARNTLFRKLGGSPVNASWIVKTAMDGKTG